MATPHLIVGNKNYSSWSFRPWIAMAVAGIPFTDEVIALDHPDTKQKIKAHSLAGRVPVLRHGDITVWESLAILEYLAETFPDANLWPRDKAARALARAVSNEMHAGFTALRGACPMNMRRAVKKLALSDDVKDNVRRIEEIWAACRKSKAADGPFLFGAFTNADAMYAPVVNRFHVYDIDVSPETRAYMQTVMALPAWKKWETAGRAESWIIPHDEA